MRFAKMDEYIQWVHGKPGIGIARVQVVVPPRLHGRIIVKGKSVKTLTESLKTRNEAEARQRAVAVRARFQKMIEAGEAELRNEADPWAAYKAWKAEFDATTGRGKWAWVADPKAEDAKVVLPETVINLWITKRNNDNRPPEQPAIDNKKSKVERMFAWLCEHRGYPKDCRDFARITKADLVAYDRDYLLPEGISRDHLIDLRSLFKLAKEKDLITVNPAAEVKPPNPTRNTRLPFSPKQQRDILEAARDPAFIERFATKGQMARGIGALAVVRWMHWGAAFTGAINSELVKVTVDKIVFDDEHGVWRVFIPGSKTLYRPRWLVMHPALIREGFLEYVEIVRQTYGADAPLFPGWNVDQVNAIANKLIRDEKYGLGITDPLLSHYSWRHVVTTRLDKVPHLVSGDLARYVCGHAPVDVHSRNYQHPDLADVKRAIDVLVDATMATTLARDLDDDVKRAA